MNRPEIKIGDRVRFRTDGEIGELNKLERSGSMGMTHTVVGMRDGLPVLNDARNPYVTHPNRLDICNDFSGIQVGDLVEVWNMGKEITEDIVVDVYDNDFMLASCAKCGCQHLISKASGQHGRYPKSDGYWYVLRIVEKAKPEHLLSDAKVGDICKCRNGSLITIKQTDDDTYDNYPIVGSDFSCRNLDGLLHDIYTKSELDIIDWQPLAPEGTAEWAKQMMLIGYVIRNWHYHNGEGRLRIKNNRIQQYVSNTWEDRCDITSTAFPLDGTMWGWQLYEPKPEPAKEPEIVAHKQHAKCLVCGKEIERLLDGHATVSIKRYSISSLYESTYSHYCGKCFLELGFDATERELRGRQQPVAEPEPEPEPKSAYKVGDWVEVYGKQYLITGRPYIEDNDWLMNNVYGNQEKYHEIDITRKLSPSEVIVNIGCLSGMVEKAYGFEKGTFILRGLSGQRNVLWLSALDAPTRELVEGLLKAQEESC